jgi:hypothetical protein
MFENYKFRPSQLDKLMSKPKRQTLFDLNLSDTTKSTLNEIFIKEYYGREKIIISKYLEKGVNQENESISLYRKFSQAFCQKNQEKFENEYLCGTPDLIFDDKVVDIKTNWDIWTFLNSDQKKAKKDYYYQLVAYMLLTEKTKAELAFCLIDNDENTIYQEFQKYKYSKNLEEGSKELQLAEEKIRKNNTYSDIPVSQRVKVFTFSLEKNIKEKVENQLSSCRQYLQNLEQKFTNLT